MYTQFIASNLILKLFSILILFKIFKKEIIHLVKLKNSDFSQNGVNNFLG